MPDVNVNQQQSQSCTQVNPVLQQFQFVAARLSQTTSSSDSAPACPGTGVVKQFNAYINVITSDGATTSADALDFWAQNKYQYSSIVPLAQDLLAAPASQAYVDRIFSMCGLLTSGRRKRINKSLEM